MSRLKRLFTGNELPPASPTPTPVPTLEDLSNLDPFWCEYTLVDCIKVLAQNIIKTKIEIETNARPQL